MKSPLVLVLFAALQLGVAGECDSVASPLGKAAAALERGSPAEAERLAAPLRDTAPRCSEVLVVLGRARAAQNDPAAAENLFFQAIEAAPKDSRAFHYLAALLFQTGDYRRADNMSEMAVSLQPVIPDALVLKAKILLMKRQEPRARELLDKAIALDPRNSGAHFEMGVLHDRNKRHADAVKSFQSVVALNPRDARAWDYLALHLEPLVEIEKAESAYRAGLAVNEKPWFDAFLDYNYGRFLSKRNRLADAKKHLDRAVELAPQTRAVWYERGKLNARMQDFQQARADAEKALALADPAGIIIDLQLYVLLETIYKRLGEANLARQYADLVRATRIPMKSEARQ